MVIYFFNALVTLAVGLFTAIGPPWGHAHPHGGLGGYPARVPTARRVPYGPRPPFYGYLTNSYSCGRGFYGYPSSVGLDPSSWRVGRVPRPRAYGPPRALRPAPAILRLSFKFYEGTKTPTATLPLGAYWGRSLPLWLVF